MAYVLEGVPAPTRGTHAVSCVSYSWPISPVHQSTLYGRSRVLGPARARVGAVRAEDLSAADEGLAVTCAPPPLLRRENHRARGAAAGAPPWMGGRHLARRGARLALLLMADLVLLSLFSLLVQLMSISPWSPTGFREALEVLPPGMIMGLSFPFAVILALAMLGAYTATGAPAAIARRIVTAVLVVTLPAWASLWERGAPLLVQGVLLLTAMLALCLVAAYRLSESSLRLVTPRRLRAARALLVAGEQDLRRAQHHPAVADRSRFVIRGAIEPAELRGRGALEALCHTIRRSGADTVLLCCGPLGDRALRVVVDAANAMGCELVSLTRAGRWSGSPSRMIQARDSALVALVSPASRALQRIVKRISDVAGAAVGLTLVAPLLGALALAIKLESPGPVLFGQRRVGAWGQPFRCLKFRTMRVDAERVLRNDPEMYAEYIKNNYKLPDGRDPRITRVGRMLRKTSLDELPQLWNVLRGDMSLIGPRPVVPDELNEYGGQRRVLLSVKPGMTGAWAIVGRSRVGYPRRAAIEVGYVRRWKLGSDLSILWRTVPAVLTRRGAH